jgi:hypothetical protein
MLHIASNKLGKIVSGGYLLLLYLISSLVLFTKTSHRMNRWLPAKIVNLLSDRRDIIGNWKYFVGCIGQDVR